MQTPTPIERIERLERFLPMLEKAFIDFEAHEKAHDLQAVGSDPALKPVTLPPAESSGFIAEAGAANGAD
jgi:hypothetical protein